MTLLLPLLLMAAVLTPTTAQHAAVPCNFNTMCSCKIMRHLDPFNRTQTPGTPAPSDYDAPDDAAAETYETYDAIGDISCVGVPFATLPGTT